MLNILGLGMSVLLEYSMGTRPSEAVVLTVVYNRALVFYMKEFELPVPSVLRNDEKIWSDFYVPKNEFIFTNDNP